MTVIFLKQNQSKDVSIRWYQDKKSRYHCEARVWSGEPSAFASSSALSWPEASAISNSSSSWSSVSASFPYSWSVVFLGGLSFEALWLLILWLSKLDLKRMQSCSTSLWPVKNTRMPPGGSCLCICMTCRTSHQFSKTQTCDVFLWNWWKS